MSGEIDVYHIEKLMLIAHITVEADSHGRRLEAGLAIAKAKRSACGDWYPNFTIIPYALSH